MINEERAALVREVQAYLARLNEWIYRLADALERALKEADALERALKEAVDLSEGSAGA